MKKFIRIISIVLCMMLIFSVGCKKEQTTTETQNGFTDGVHIYEISETNEYVVKEGKTDYKIVIPADADNMIVIGAEEFQLFFEEATGIRLEIITDAEIEFSSSAKHIIFGSEKFMSKAGISTDYKVLNRNGYIIKTVGSSIFVCGAHVEGTMFGAYGLLEQMFEYDCFSNSAYYLKTDVTDLKLMNYNITNAPDIEIRHSGFRTVIGDTKTMYRMGYISRTDGSVLVHEASSHTLNAIISRDKYNTEKIMVDGVEVDNPDYHPDWFSTCGQQWCFTAHGNDEELALMQEVVFEVAKNAFMTNLKGSVFTIGVEDKNTNCACEECSRKLLIYKAPSGVYLEFANAIAEKIKVWMESDEGKPYAREFLVKIIAYQKHEAAPAQYNEATGKFEPIQGLVAHDNVTVEFSPSTIDFQVSIHDEENLPYRQSMAQWQAICKNISGFAHTVNFYHLFIPYDVFNSKQDQYKWLAAANTVWFYDEGDMRQTGAVTGWNTLKVYLISELGWDVNIDWAGKIDHFFDKYFQEAAEPMRKFFDSYRVHSKNMIDNGGMNVSLSINFTSLQKKFWPSGMLELWSDYIDQALETISDIKYYDLDRYNQLYDRITLERISVYYMMVAMYSDRYGEEELLKMKLAVREDCDRLGLNHLPPDLNKLWEQWGIQ